MNELANIGAGVALVRADDGEIVYTNDRWDTMFGYEPGELLGRHISVVNAATDQTPAARAQEIYGALRRDGMWSGDVHNVRKDQSDFWSSCNVSRFDHPEHGPVWLAVNTDITTRRAADRRLRESERSYRRVFDASPAPLALIDGDLCLSLVNQAFADLLGWRRDELEGKALPALTHADDVARCMELREQVLTGDATRYEVEERLLTPHSRPIPVLMRANVIRGDNGGPIAEVATIERLENHDAG